MTKTITRQDIVPLPTYRQRRDEYLGKMIDYKKNRRVKLAEHISLLFENRNTVLFQIQELANSEDLTDPKELDEYIEIYSGMLPSHNELSATLFIEMDDQSRLQNLLVKLKGIENHLFLHLGGETIQAIFEEEHDERGYTTSVHYLKFPLSETAKSLLQSESNTPGSVRLTLTHPNLSGEVTLSPQCIASIQKK